MNINPIMNENPGTPIAEITREEGMKNGLAKILEGSHLEQAEARDLMYSIMRGEATPAQIGGLLMALRMKGETVDEITGFAEAMRGQGGRILTDGSGLLDTCGTGGSGIHKFNISTASAIIASAVSVRVAKHGNRSASGKAGSADVLEALGVNIHLNGEQARQCLDDIESASFCPGISPFHATCGRTKKRAGCSYHFQYARTINQSCGSRSPIAWPV